MRRVAIVAVCAVLFAAFPVTMFARSATAGSTQSLCGIVPGLGSFQAELKGLIGNVEAASTATIANTEPSVGDMQAFVNGKQAPLDAVFADPPLDSAVADAWATATTGLHGILDLLLVAGDDLSNLPPSSVQQLVDGANGIVVPGTPVNTDVVNAQAAFDAFFQAYCPTAPPTNVASVPSAGAGGGSVAINSPTGTTLSGVSASPVSGSPVAPPSGAQFPAGVLSFTVSGAGAGGTADVTITLPSGSNPNGYLKLNPQGTAWVDFSSRVTIVGDVVTLHLQDGDAFDTNAASGVIGDPGAPAVVYRFTGFAAPIDNGPVNSAKAGQAIPVKWTVTTAAGAAVSNPASFVSLTSNGGPCGAGTPDPIETYAPGASGLVYDGNGAWHLNWKTDKAWAGQCRQLALRLADGTSHSAQFKFK